MKKKLVELTLAAVMTISMAGCGNTMSDEYVTINKYKDVYKRQGKTDGIFQLESAGMKGFMKELKPHSLADIIAGISLYRPGPMDFIPQYIKGKKDASSITYDCPQLEPILAPTYGCIVYQEQVMQIVQALAGYTPVSYTHLTTNQCVYESCL